MSDTLKKKLKQVEDDLAQLRLERADKIKARNEAREKFAQPPNYDTNSDEFKAAQESVKLVGEVDEKISEAQAAQVGILKMLGQSDHTAGDVDVRYNREKGERPSEDDGWNSNALFANETGQRLKALANSSQRFGSIDLGEVASREVMKADLVGTTNARRAAYGGAIPPMRRQLSVLNIIPSGTMDNNAFPYTQEGGTYAAAETAEGTAKPEAGITLTDATATAVTVAHWKKVNKQALEDQAALQSIVDSHLRYGVLRRLEGQVVAGDGTGSNMTGILNTSGIQTQTFTAGANLSDQILAGITKTLIAEGQADGIVVHPTDFQSILTAKASGSGQYLAGGPFATVTTSLWGIPLIPTPAIAVGNALVGDFAMGAQVFVRSGVNVLMSDSNENDFLTNKVALLGEGRFALAVWRPVAFTKVALA